LNGDPLSGPADLPDFIELLVDFRQLLGVESQLGGRVEELIVQFETTVSIAAMKRLNRFTGARVNFRCGRLCARYIASEAPALFVMMRREKPHQSTSAGVEEAALVPFEHAAWRP
jgi:hypothetical protein